MMTERSKVLAGLLLFLTAPLVSSQETVLFRISLENVSQHFQSQFVKRFAETLAVRAGADLKGEYSLGIEGPRLR